jgi:hypothetical protein
MTTFTTEDREALEKGLEFFASVRQSSPPHIVDSGASIDKEDREQMLREQLHIMQAEIQRLRKKLMEAGIHD